MSRRKARLRPGSLAEWTPGRSRLSAAGGRSRWWSDTAPEPRSPAGGCREAGRPAVGRWDRDAGRPTGARSNSWTWLQLDSPAGWVVACVV